MNKGALTGYIKIVLLSVMVVVVSACDFKKNKEKEMIETLSEPKAQKVPKELIKHGHKRIDNYYWLNDRKNPEVINYLNAENAYTEAKMKHTESLQEDIYNEIVGRIKQDDSSVPYLLNGYYYQSKYEEGKEYPVILRKKNVAGAKEEILIDQMSRAEGTDYYSLGDYSVSINNNVLAFSEDIVSRRKYTIRFKNLETGEMYRDEIPTTTGGIAWANDNQTIFYTRKNEKTLRAYQIYRHTLGEDPKEDVLVYQEDDEQFDCFVFTTKSRKYIMIGSFSTLSSEYRFLDADLPTGEFIVLQERMPEVEYHVSHYKDKFYIRTNLNASNFRLMEVPIENSGVEQWQEVIPHRKDVLLEGNEVFDDYLVLEERENGLPQIRVLKHGERRGYLIDMPEEAYNCWVGTNHEFNTSTLRFGYTSMITPSSVYDFNMETKDRQLRKQQEVVGGYNAKDYRTERLMVPVRDGVKVPVSLVYHKDTPINGTAPLLLYGYGSYGYSLDAGFGLSRLSLLDRGFVFAIAHIRGGEEMGRHWYEDGKFLKKKNTFYDFIDCGKYLVQKDYAGKDQLFAMGGSAGGMLMGGVMNMEPGLWKGVVAAVPFVDVVTTMLDTSIPLTTGEYEEWGNPNNKTYYEYMLSYSPYDNVESKNYPNLLVTTGLHDSQVQYWEPAKWVAKLRELKTDNNLLLLKTNMEAGHGGASGRFARYKEIALEYAFLLDLAK